MARTVDGDRRAGAIIDGGRVLLDKWLWAARFFKTRTLATEAVAGGKVHVGGHRAKPAHAVRIGDILRVQRGFDEYLITVIGLSERRGSAKAVLLYEETAESRQRREQLAEQRRLLHLASPPPISRPTKQDRRRIIRFTRRNEPDDP